MIRIYSHSHLCWRLSRKQLQNLLEHNTTWGQKRSTRDLHIMLQNSAAVVSIWQKKKLIGFGRATSDYIYRAVLWDIVVDKRYQGLGYGKIIVSKLLEHKALNKVEKIYLMTTYQKGFYEQIGFKLENNQNLMIHNAERNIF